MKKIVAGSSALALLLGAAAAHAQTAANLNQVVRVVKRGKPATETLVDARLGDALEVGDRVRTAGRSGARLKFSDGSLLTLGELTEIVVTSRRQRDVRVVRGKVHANYKSPGTISGGDAVAAVRGTQLTLEVDEQGQKTLVRCYQGLVFVASASNPISAGVADQVSGTTLVDDVLQDSTVDWTGGQIQFTDGPFANLVRSITGFNRETGTVTFTPALPARGEGESGYLLRKNPGDPVIPLRSGQGTTVRPNQAPGGAYPVANAEFAGGVRQPFFQNEQDHLQTYPGTQEHQTVQEQQFAADDAIRSVLGLNGGRRTPAPHGEDDCGGEPLPPGKFGAKAFGMRPALGRQFAQATGTGRPAPRPEEIFLPQNVQPPYPTDEGVDNVLWRFEPYGFLTDGSSATGARVRLSGVSGDVYGEIGYRYTLVDGSRSQHDLSEAFLHLRGHHGEVIAGRQHLFLGPANNNDIGTLLGLQASDAVVLQRNFDGFRQQVAYLMDTQALRRRGHHGFYARGQAPFRGGYVGYSLLHVTEDGHNLGWSFDASQPILPNKVDGYFEVGRGINNRHLFMGGLYFPALYHRAKVDLFLEYAVREDAAERATLRLRHQLGNHLLLIGFIDRLLGDDEWDAGAGFVYTLTFR
ncbi:MAG: FecR domain-containing protein [Armatimonadota bacterium]